MTIREISSTRRWVACGIAVALAGCSPGAGPSNDPPAALSSCRSWIATARLAVGEWIDGSVTRVFTRQTLEGFERELPKQMAELSKDTLRGDLPRTLGACARIARHAAIDARGAIEALDRERARADLAALAAADSSLAGAIEREYPWP